MLDFDPERQAVTPRDAATVVVVRETSAGLEVFCVQRHARSGFLGGAVVFPGGKVDASDRSEQWQDLSSDLSPRVRSFGPDEATARAFAVAALRELLEEAAILPVAGARLDGQETALLRSELANRASSEGDAPAFAALLRERGLRADTSRLEALARWITPAAESRRYDTRFYILPAPDQQHGAHDRHETTDSFWATPREVLARWERGEFFLAPPTSRMLGLLLTAPDIRSALAIAAAQSLDPVCPFFTMDGDQGVLALPGDPLYPEPAPPPADDTAPTRFVLVDGRFVGRRVVWRSDEVELSPGPQRPSR